ncbi:MAG: PAS domain-containing protein [Armatimonadetes bacterium]|nr:PAS domain-containing protein [Armatimonadota bacterium]MDE2206324.1 PAS domain-containing protein [Armatimonadota bacterium]
MTVRSESSATLARQGFKTPFAPFESAFLSAPVATLFTDGAGLVTAANRAAGAIFQSLPHRLVSRSMQALFHPDSEPLLGAALAEQQRSEKPVTVTARTMLGVSVRVTVQDCSEAGHNVAAWYLVADDSTVQQSVAAGALQLEALHDIDQPVLASDLQGRLTFANTSALALLRQPYDAALAGRTAEAIVAAETAEMIRRVEVEVAESGQPQRDVQEAWELAGGDRYQLVVRRAPLRNAVGKVTGVVTFLRHAGAERLGWQQSLDSDQVLAAFAAQAPAIVWVTDRDLTMISAFGTGLRASGVPSEDLIGRSMADIIGISEDAPTAMAAHRRALAGDTVGYEIEWQGQYYHCQVDPLRDSLQQITGVVGAGVDVTALRRASAVSEDERNLLRTLIDNLPDLIYVKDVTGRYMVTNEAHRAMTGPEPAIGRSDFELMPYALAAAGQVDEQQVLTTGEARHSEGPAVDCHGQWRWMASMRCPLRDADGQVIGIVGVNRDITDRKKADAERQDLLCREQLARAEAERATEQERHLRSITDTALAQLPLDELLAELLRRIREILNIESLAVLLGAADTDIYEVKGTLGYSGAMGQRLGANRTVTSEDLAEDSRTLVGLCSAIQNAAGEPRFAHVELKAEGRCIGLLRVGSRTASGYSAEDDELLQLVADRLALAIDRTRLYQALQEELAQKMAAERTIRRMNADLEARVKQRTRELDVAVKDLEDYSYMVSHDLAAPLRAIDNFAKIIDDDHGADLSDDAKGCLERVRRNADHMGNLLKDLLEFSRTSRQAIKLQPVAIDEMVRNIVADQVAGAMGTSAAFQIGQLPVCQGDPTLLQMVFTNLIVNAIKFSSKVKQPQIAIDTVQQADDATETIFFVRDNGVGFNMKYAAKLFKVFQRLHSVEQFPGTGAGLAIVHKIVTRHGGRIWAEAEVNAGACFYVAIPKGTAVPGSSAQETEA